jgi:hypothetical protein
MAYDCRIYRILIASPSDVEDERDIAVKVIQEWNDLYSYSRKVALLPLRWETHTAPEYGTRPQEVINQAIVDECDLLVGIFWTRIGSPTGIADSGTLEEIERVGKAGKPIMLYFSRVEIDPDRIEINQINKLKRFKEQTYPKGLIEHYKKTIEFRDKFAKQLELKIRDLQRNDNSEKIPLSLEFVSSETGELAGNMATHCLVVPSVANYDEVSLEDRELVKKIASEAIREKVCIPIPLVINNASASGVRNLYVELIFSSASQALELRDNVYSSYLLSGYRVIQSNSESRQRVGRISADHMARNLSKFNASKLQRIDEGWRLSFEWEALQPQRVRLIEPVLYLYTQGSATLVIKAKVFADTFPEPLSLDAYVTVAATSSPGTLLEIVPNWHKLTSVNGSSGLIVMVDDDQYVAQSSEIRGKP